MGWHMAHMGDMSGEYGIWWGYLIERDHQQNVHVWERIILK